MTAEEMLTELAQALERPLDNQAQWHALVARLDAWRQEAVSAEKEAWAELAQRTWESDHGAIRGITNLAPLIRARK